MTLGAGLSREEGGDAGIAEQVQDLRRPSERLQALAREVPMRRLLREEAEMPERREPCEERHALVGHGERLGDPPGELPSPVAGLVLGGGAEEDGVGFCPQVRTAPAAHGLRLGPVDEKPAEALELAPLAEIDEPVIGKSVGGEQPGVVWLVASGRRHRAKISVEA